MSANTLALSLLASVVTAALYLYIGGVLRKRRVSDSARLANNMFVLWWKALGGLGLLGAGVMLLYLADRLEIWVYQAYTTFALLVVFLALWGLQFYLVYLYTGSKRSFLPLAVFYAAMFLITVARFEYGGAPEAITDNGWQLRPEPTVEYSLAFNLGFSLLIIGPAIVAAIAYACLYRKTDDRTQKYRIAMVTGAIIVWFGSSIVGTAAEVTTNLAWQVFSRAISVAAALTILMAYKPPAWVRRKLGVASVEATPEAEPRGIEVGLPPTPPRM